MKHLPRYAFPAAMLMGCAAFPTAIKAQTPTEVSAQSEANDSIPDFTELDEFVITTRKEVIKSDGAKLSYDLDEDDSSKGQNMLDALKKVPMVSVDGTDQIRVKGSTNFKIYVNGKEEPMLTANAGQVLKSMPAESVSKIEVITEPGAKYDAEGTGGIINLITERKQRKDGYTGSLTASGGTNQQGLSAYGRVKYDKVTADANINYATNRGVERTQDSTTDTYDFENQSAYRLIQRVRQKFAFDYIGGGFNLSWEPSEKNLFTASANIYSVGANVSELNIFGETWSQAGALTASSLQTGHGKMENLGLSSNASYKRTLDDKGQNIILAYGFNLGKSLMQIGYLNDFTVGQLTTNSSEENRNENYNREHTVTADYTNLIGGKHNLEAGLKGIFRRNTGDGKQWTGLTPDDLILNADNSMLTRQLQDIYAVYASYTSTFGKLGVKAGLRYEHTYMGMDFLTGTMNNYRRNLDDVVPNAALTWMFGPATNLRLAYQMRINRPGIEQMNPYRFSIVSTEVRMGNPDLKSVHNNTLTLTYSNYGRIVGGNISLEASQADNSIEEYIYYDGMVKYQTYGNIGNMRRISLNGFLNWNISNRFSLGVNGDIFFTSIKSTSPRQSNHSWDGTYGANFSYMAPARFKISGYGGQSTGNITLQGRWNGWYYYGLSIGRSFLKNDALTLTLNASNFLTKSTHWSGRNATPGHLQISKGINPQWNVGLSVSWNFGHLSDQVKKTGADLDNNDKSTSGKQNGGIGL
ncbi:MAG: TonB-dependent receptor [Muribaculaceae bacterium]|nr:TonB-dependent receptor [Muribaculaceae bacterium]